MNSSYQVKTIKTFNIDLISFFASLIDSTFDLHLIKVTSTNPNQ